jgi:hypothetical protein
MDPWRTLENDQLTSFVTMHHYKLPNKERQVK